MNKDFRVLYVGHRFHTNQIPVMQGWNEYGIKPMFLAQYEGVGEEHDSVEFRLMKLSLLCRPLFYFLDKKYGPASAESKKINAFIPSLYDTIKQIKSYNPDLVIIRDYRKGNVVITLACKILGIKKVIMYVQDPLYGDYNKGNILRFLFRKLFFPSIAFTPVLRKGEDRKTTLISSVHDAPKYFIPLVYKARQKNRDCYCKEGVIHILDIGKFRDYKNHFLVVEAFSKVKHPENFEVTIIGQLSNKSEHDYFNRLVHFIKEKKLENIINLRGHVDYKEMNKIYANSDVLLLASKNETAGMVILEAMAEGLCVISGFNCGLTSYIDEFNCGLSFSEKQVYSLVEILDNLVENRQVIGEMGMKAQKVAKEEFCFNKYKIRLNKLLQKEFNYNLPV